MSQGRGLPLVPRLGTKPDLVVGGRALMAPLGDPCLGLETLGQNPASDPSHPLVTRGLTSAFFSLIEACVTYNHTRVHAHPMSRDSVYTRAPS